MSGSIDSLANRRRVAPNIALDISAMLDRVSIDFLVLLFRLSLKKGFSHISVYAVPKY